MSALLMGWLMLAALIFPLNPEQTPRPLDSAFAYFEASPENPLTGQPFTLSLIAVLPEGMFVAEWPEIAGTWGPFEVREAGELIENGRETRQDFTVVLWRPEDVLTPETQIAYGSGSSGVRRIPVRELVVSVPTVLHPDDITPRPPLPPMFTSWYAPAAVLIIGGLAALGIVVSSFRRREAEEIAPDAVQIILQRLRAAAKYPLEKRFQVTLELTRELYHIVPDMALYSVISAGEAIGYASQKPDYATIETFCDMALRAARGVANG